MSTIRLQVNGQKRQLDADADIPLLYALRDQLGLQGPKFGCGLGQCGACTVIVDGKAVRSCVTPVRTMEKKAITTLEGLGSSAKPHPIQQAFIDEQAVQCGYCMNGIVMNAKVLLDKNPSPTLDQTSLGGASPGSVTTTQPNEVIIAATLIVCFAPALFFAKRSGQSTSEFFGSITMQQSVNDPPSSKIGARATVGWSALPLPRQSTRTRGPSAMSLTSMRIVTLYWWEL